MFKREKKIKLVYWHTNIENYGDILSAYIVSKISGCKIIHKNFAEKNWKKSIFMFLQSILKFDFQLTTSYLFPFEKNLLAVGSILARSNKRSSIWGCGFMSEKEDFNGGEIFALRGSCSLNRINDIFKKKNKKALNDKDVVLADPGLLLPLIFRPIINKEYTVGIIPHFSEYEFFKTNFSKKFHIICLMSNDIEAVTKEILSCHYILSTSLHGIIVAHAYNIPALWMEYSGLEKGTNGFKFLDYFSSVKIEPYKPIRNIQDTLYSLDSVLQTFSEFSNVSLPNCDISQLQRDLLRCAPFKVLEKFQM